MRIVKPYGSTKTGTVEGGALIRSIHPSSIRHKSQNIEEFAKSHPKLVLSQWISMIDKVITKPSEGDAPSLHQYNLREEVGAAAWSIIQTNDLLSAPSNRIKRLEREWWSRIHPYGRETEPTGALDFRGRWFQVFSSQSDPARIDAEAIAKALFSHLYEAECRLGDGVPPRSVGLIAARARSISANVPSETGTAITSDPPWSDDDVAVYLRDPSILAAVTRAIKKYDGQREARTRRAVGRALHDHYARVFAGADGAPQSISEASNCHPGLIALHEAAKSRFQRLLKAPQAHWKKKLPATAEEFVAALNEDWRNREVNALIRLGKVIHFEAAPEGKEDSPAHLFDNWSVDVSKSHFWTTDGQTEIKINEAFVRVWRHVISFASRTATNWADQNATFDRDILGARQREAAVNALDTDHFDRTAAVLFGSSNVEFSSSDRAYRQEVLKLALTELSRLRNAAFHYSGLTTFLEVLGSLGDAAGRGTLDAVRRLHLKDALDLADRLRANLRSVNAEYYLDQSQMDAFTKALASEDVRIDDLPALQDVLRRGQYAFLWRKDVDLGLPKPATAETLQEPSARCQHLILKLLYERAFGGWLCQLPAETLRTYVDRYTVRATNEARRISGNDKLMARASGNIKILDGDTIFDIFAMLRANSFAEARDAKKHRRFGRDLGKYLRDLELDLIAQALQDFVEGSGLGWVFDLKEEWHSKQAKSKIGLVDLDQSDNEDWLSVLYFLLHLVPVDEVNKLSHQISRSGIRCGDQAVIAVQLLSVLSLYERSHDAKFKGLEGAFGRATLAPLFESGELARTILARAEMNAASGRGSIRALREMLRFEPPPSVINALAKVPIGQSHFETVSTHVPDIAELQVTRARLHSKWVKDGRRLNASDTETYSICLTAIVAHREATHHIHLTNHLNTYRLLIASLAKLVDYVGVWERDLYFTTLALLYRSGVAPEDVFATSQARRLLGRGQIIEALRQRDRNVACDFLFDTLRKLFEFDNLTGGDARITTRNELVHFGMLQDQGRTINLTELVNQTRHLVSYDRKRANRVSVSVRDVFARFGLALTWQSEGGNLSNAEVEADMIHHLGRRELSEQLVGSEFVALVRTIL